MWGGERSMGSSRYGSGYGPNNGYDQRMGSGGPPAREEYYASRRSRSRSPSPSMGRDVEPPPSSYYRDGERRYRDDRDDYDEGYTRQSRTYRRHSRSRSRSISNEREAPGFSPPPRSMRGPSSRSPSPSGSSGFEYGRGSSRSPSPRHSRDPYYQGRGEGRQGEIVEDIYSSCEEYEGDRPVRRTETLTRRRSPSPDPHSEDRYGQSSRSRRTQRSRARSRSPSSESPRSSSPYNRRESWGRRSGGRGGSSRRDYRGEGRQGQSPTSSEDNMSDYEVETTVTHRYY